MSRSTPRGTAPEPERPTGDIKARLRAFAAANRKRPGIPCSTCSLPAEVLEAVREERARGTQYSVIAGFLKSIGHDINQKRVSAHFNDHEQQRQG